MSVERIFVAGAGLMGSGIAQTAAQRGIPVTLQDVSEAALARGRALIAESLDRLRSRDRITDDERALTLSRITETLDRSAAAGADLVIEAITEAVEAKHAFWRELEELCPPTTLFASNTSSIPITSLAAVTHRPEHFIGMHFYSPVPVMSLVEIIRGVRTDDATFTTIEELARRLGKTPVTASDLPGFVGNRILIPYLNEAMYALMQGAGTPETIDTVAKLGFRHPMGPLELADFIGLDVVYSICEVMYEGFRDPRYAPCPLLQRLVEAGHLGRKTGRGFYVYGASASGTPAPASPLRVAGA